LLFSNVCLDIVYPEMALSLHYDLIYITGIGHLDDITYYIRELSVCYP